MNITKEFVILLVDDWEVHRQTTKTFLKHFPFVSKVFTAANSTEMIQMVMEHPEINTLIIDFNLGEDSLNGMQAYTLLQEAGYDLPAILVTGNDIDAYESYTVGILDVVSKRFLYDYKRISQAIMRLGRYHLMQELRENDYAYVTVYDGKILQLLPSQVVFIESDSPKTLVHTTLRAEPYSSVIAQKSYEDYLENSKFERLSRWHLVNTDHIESYDDESESILLSNGKSLSVSSSYKKYIKKLLSERKTPKTSLMNFLLGCLTKSPERDKQLIPMRVGVDGDSK